MCKDIQVSHERDMHKELRVNTVSATTRGVMLSCALSHVPCLVD